MSNMPGNTLSLDDLAQIIEVIHDAVDKWHNIGIQLGLHDLKSIESNYSQQNDRLREMICKWLQNKAASWKKMVAALKSRTVGEAYLAERLEEQYCKSRSAAQITVTKTEISNYKSTEVSGSKYSIGGFTPFLVASYINFGYLDSVDWNNGME